MNKKKCAAPWCDNLVVKAEYCPNHVRQIRKWGEVRRTRYDKHEFCVCGDYVKIFLVDREGKRNGFNLLVDKDDLDNVLKYKWGRSGKHKTSGNTYYAHAHINGKKVKLHHFVLGGYKRICSEAAIDRPEIDHKNNNGLDNRKKNLRVVTSKQNKFNRLLNKNNTSGTRGVQYNKKRKKWIAVIKNDYKAVLIGEFPIKEQAIKARKKAEKKLGYNF